MTFPEVVYTQSLSRRQIIGTLRYEDGKARTGTAVDAGNFRGSRCVVKNKAYFLKGRRRQ